MSVLAWIFVFLILFICVVIVWYACKELRLKDFEIKSLTEERGKMSNKFRVQGNKLTEAERQLKRCLGIKGKSKF